MQRTPLLAALVVSTVAGCSSQPIPATTQTVRLSSGDFGVVDRAEVTSVDFIRFNDSDARFGEAASLIARELLNQRERSIPFYLEQLVGEFSLQLVDQVEQEIRSRNCIYTLRPSRAAVTSIILENARSNSLSVADRLDDFATATELAELDRLDDLLFDAEYDRLIEKYTPSIEALDGEISEFGVASQCLINVRVGDVVTIVKFEDIITISPPLTADSYALRSLLADQSE